MNDQLRFLLTLGAALGSGLVAGVFFAFSTFVMRGLGRIPPAAGLAAMQAINVAVINPLFLGVFLGTGLACVGLAADAVRSLAQPGAVAGLLGGVVYLGGVLVVTLGFNVPRNDALASLDPAAASSVAAWADFCRSWTAWNHVRTGAAMASAALLTLALVELPSPWKT